MRLGVPTQSSEASLRLHRIGRVGRRAQAPLRDALREQIVEAGLDDRASPGVDRLDLVGIDVHADDFMAVRGERRGRHASDVPETKD